MTISTENQNDRYLGNDVTTVFPYNFKTNEAAHLEVIIADADDVQTTLVLDVDYTVSDVGEDSGNVTYLGGGTPLPTGWSITLNRVVPLLQSVDLENQGNFFAETHEAVFDYLIMADQQQDEVLSRCLQISKTSGLSGDDLLTGIDTSIAAAEAAQAAAEAAQLAAETAQTGAELAETNAGVSEVAAAASAAAALISENAAAADAILTAADLVLTNADVVLTHADVVLTGLDVATTNADVILTGLDVVTTNADVVLAAASAAAALVSENNASTSETNAAISAAAALVSENNAATSEANAAAVVAVHAALTVTHGVTGDLLGTTDTQNISNKTITASKIVSKTDTKANLETYATTATNGELLYASDEKAYYGVEDGALVALGGGGAGDPSMYGLMDHYSGDGSTFGNNATFDNGGTLQGAFSIDDVTPISGDKSYKYVQAAGSLNDWMKGPDVEVFLRSQNRTNVSKFVVDYDGDDNDEEFLVYDVDSSEILQSIPIKNGLHQYSILFDLLTQAEIAIGVHVKTENIGAILRFDNLYFSDEPFCEAALTEQQSTELGDGNGHGSSSTAIRRFTTTVKETGSDLYEDSGDSATLGREFTMLKRAKVTVSYSDWRSGGTSWTGISVNSNQLTTAIDGITKTHRKAATATVTGGGEQNASWTGILEIGDVVRAHDALSNDATVTAHFSISAISVADHVLVASDIEDYNWNDYTPVFQAHGTPTNVDFKWRRVGGNVEIQGKFTSGTATAVETQIGLPTGLVVRSGSTIKLVGLATGAHNTASQARMLATSGDSYLNIGVQSSGSAGLTPQNGNVTYGTGQTCSFFASVPIQGWTGTGITTLALPTSEIQDYNVTASSAGALSEFDGEANWCSFTSKILGRYTYALNTDIYTVFPKIDPTVNVAGYTIAVLYGTFPSFTVHVYNPDTGVYVDSLHQIGATKAGADAKPPGVFVGNVSPYRVAYIKDVKSSAVTGGLSSTSYSPRTLTTVSGNIDLVTLASNKFTIEEAGEYLIEFSTPGYNCGYFKSKLVRDPAGTPSDEIIGSSENASTADDVTANSLGEDYVTLTSSTTFDIQQRCNSATANGLGRASGFGDNEIYTQVKVTQLRKA